MTFSIIARCAHTGQLGIACATSDFAVGSRVPHAQARIGAIATQHSTDPRLGRRALSLLASGCTAQQAVDGCIASADNPEARQIAVIASIGSPASWSGSLVDRVGSAEVVGEHCIAVGNMLATPDVATAMVSSFERSPSSDFGDRLVEALGSGLVAGGEIVPVRSAALYIVASQEFPYVDLRVDDHDEPLAELSRLWSLYAPRRDEFVTRAISPAEPEGH